MTRLRRKARESLESLIRAGKPIPETYFTTATEKQMDELILLATREGNRAFLAQARAKVKYKQREPGSLLKVTRVPLSDKVRAQIDNRSRRKFEEHMADQAWKDAQRKKYSEKKVWVQMYEGGAPGLVQQK